ncbi:MAG TPA: LolA-related protein [Rhodanobacteraceae bacterium]|nr:LolA-related protein [Rhodanobacteraceae bacterium]
MRRSARALVWLLVPVAALAATPDLAQSLIVGMGQTPPAETPFIQVSYRAVLDRPLIASGTLRWLGGERLERDTTEPFQETARLGDGELTVQRGPGRVHRIALARAPQAAALLTGFSALLSGDAAGLERDFTLSATGDAAHWVITLAPRTRELQQRIASIVVDGRGHAPDCLVLHDANGDATFTLMGTLAKAGLKDAAPAQAALAARCQAGP